MRSVHSLDSSLGCGSNFLLLLPCRWRFAFLARSREHLENGGSRHCRPMCEIYKLYPSIRWRDEYRLQMNIPGVCSWFLFCLDFERRCTTMAQARNSPVRFLLVWPRGGRHTPAAEKRKVALKCHISEKQSPCRSRSSTSYNCSPLASLCRRKQERPYW